MSASIPTWVRLDTGPPYTAFLQQAGAASTLPLTAASSVQLRAKSTGQNLLGVATTAVLIFGNMTIASPAQGYVTYAWGPSDLVLPDLYNVNYKISWQDGTTETVPNDSYDQFVVFPDLEAGSL